MTVLRIAFVGDSITNGTLDGDFLGWPGRLCRAERDRGHDLTLYNLGVRAETSQDIRARWRAECAPRLPEAFPGALVFAFGVNDCAEYDDGSVRVSQESSVENARAIIAEAKDWRPTLWIGPGPAEMSMQPLRPGPGVSYSFHNDRTESLSSAYAAAAVELGVPYLDVFTPLRDDAVWAAALRDGDGVHPTGDGYARIAALVGGWPAWRAWFDV
jgi:acyl-CoA thioesterase-1